MSIQLNKLYPVQKANNGPVTRPVYHTSPLNWSEDLSPMFVDKWKWGQQAVRLP